MKLKLELLVERFVSIVPTLALHPNFYGDYYFMILFILRMDGSNFVLER